MKMEYGSKSMPALIASPELYASLAKNKQTYWTTGTGPARRHGAWSIELLECCHSGVNGIRKYMRSKA
jgi:hypothetical protein